jgi:hypothetical protein
VNQPQYWPTASNAGKQIWTWVSWCIPHLRSKKWTVPAPTSLTERIILELIPRPLVIDSNIRILLIHHIVLWVVSNVLDWVISLTRRKCDFQRTFQRENIAFFGSSIQTFISLFYQKEYTFSVLYLLYSNPHQLQTCHGPPRARPCSKVYMNMGRTSLNYHTLNKAHTRI